MSPDTEYSLPAPAKLNLFLHIVGQREDGYHLLQTVFQLLDYGDTLHFTPNQSGAVTLTDQLPGVNPEHNLIYRAAMMLKPCAPANVGVGIRLDKRIPMGAGLGGGSSDAATTLLALNRLWNCQLPVAQLAEMGAQLGADVPVFVHGQTAWAEGVGEQLYPIETPPGWYLVIYPGIAVNTAEIFRHPQLTRNTPASRIRALTALRLGNDCQAVVTSHYPEVAKALDWLTNFSQALMTGTGSSIFARFASRDQAQAVLDQLPSQWQGFVAQATPTSTALESLAEIVI